MERFEKFLKVTQFVITAGLATVALVAAVKAPWHLLTASGLGVLAISIWNNDIKTLNAEEE